MNPDYVIFLDGGITANPGGEIAVAAVVCTPEGELYIDSSKMAGQGTNNVAEYRALRHAVAMARLVGARRPLFLSDSMLIVQQINKWWAIKNSDLAVEHGYCSSALMEFDRWQVKHIPREQNKRADWLACKQLGHGRTLKKPPEISRVSCDNEGQAGWAELAAAGKRG